MYRELGLQLCNKTPKCRVKAKLREDRRAATRPNETWAMDFVQDQLATGQKLRVLTIVDTFSRFSPTLETRLSFRGTDVVEMLERVGRAMGIVNHDPNRSGQRVRVARLGCVGLPTGGTLGFSRPGKPTDNAVIEAFNGRFGAECFPALGQVVRSSSDGLVEGCYPTRYPGHSD
jgi:putative transposase